MLAARTIMKPTTKLRKGLPSLCVSASSPMGGVPGRKGESESVLLLFKMESIIVEVAVERREVRVAVRSRPSSRVGVGSRDSIVEKGRG